MDGTVKVSSEGLERLGSALTDAGEEYKNYLLRLTALIEQITSGDIQGNPANELLDKYREKENSLKGLAQTIDDAQEYMGIKKADFTTMLEGLMEGMR